MKKVVNRILKVFDLPKENIFLLARIDDSRVLVTTSKNKKYTVSNRNGVYYCTCPDGMFRRNRNCKHIRPVKGAGI